MSAHNKNLMDEITPLANENQMVVAGNARFTILTDRMIRCEYSADRIFEDRASQHIWYRDLSAPFTCEKTDEKLMIKTGKLSLVYDLKSDSFCDSLTITSNDFSWAFGDSNEDNLMGTFRTLDNCVGSYHMENRKNIELSNGLLSKKGWAVIDDSNTLVFNEKGYLENRKRNDFDLYFMGYGHDYKDCLRDYYKIAGSVPLIPKWALGIWWSRWEKYDQKDVLHNAKLFEDHGIPLSACVIDMDWHIVENEYNDGWTGYTWNDQLFPSPEEMFDILHSKDIHACMNLHPAGGVYPHEKQYKAMAEAMGIDPETKQPVEFDIADPHYIDHYFKLLHHPLEEQGVDFWWIDWQQGTKTKMNGLDPLWYLNHLHSLDLKRNGDKRPFTFSRWSDHGAHRYPIGFSGDTYARWETLNFLPYFTANAANIGYGWWSHDTGGFARGYHNDNELYTRWVQFSAFSPIFRLHCCGDPTLDYMPWSKPEEYKNASIAVMKLRRTLAPYLYTAASKNNAGGVPLVRGMYVDYPDKEEAYAASQQYMFGDDMIVAPFTQPIDREIGLAKQVVWLPEGGWYNLFSGEFYAESGYYPVYGTINDIPVFVKAGASIPFEPEKGLISLVVFPGEGRSTLYWDDGTSMDYKNGSYAIYELNQFRGQLSVNKIAGNSGYADNFSVHVVDECWNLNHFIDSNAHRHDRKCTPGSSWPVGNNVKKYAFTLSKEQFKQLIHGFDITAHAARPVLTHFESWSQDVSLLKAYKLEFTDKQIQCILEKLTGCGSMEITQGDGRNVLFYWNHRGDDQFKIYTSKRFNHWYESSVFEGKGSKFEAFDCDSDWKAWQAYANYGNLLTYCHGGRIDKKDK